MRPAKVVPRHMCIRLRRDLYAYALVMPSVEYVINIRGGRSVHFDIEEWFAARVLPFYTSYGPP